MVKSFREPIESHFKRKNPSKMEKSSLFQIRESFKFGFSFVKKWNLQVHPTEINLLLNRFNFEASRDFAMHSEININEKFINSQSNGPRIEPVQINFFISSKT